MPKLGEKYDGKIIRKWLSPWIGHEHIMDIKQAPSIEKFRAVAPDIYVLGALASQAVFKATILQSEAENSLAWAEKNNGSQAFIAQKHGELYAANHILRGMREVLDEYRLENPEYDPELVVDEASLPVLD